MADMVEITCKCGCGRKKMVRVADVKRGWGLYYSKSCKAKHQGTQSDKEPLTLTTKDYRDMDMRRKFKFRDEKKALARKHGYEYISEACHMLYLEYGNNRAAEAMEMTEGGIHNVLLFIGVKFEPRGGRRVSNSVLTEDLAKKAKAIWDGTVTKEYIEALKIVLGVEISNNAMRMCLHGQTWGDV